MIIRKDNVWKCFTCGTIVSSATAICTACRENDTLKEISRSQKEAVKRSQEEAALAKQRAMFEDFDAKRKTELENSLADYDRAIEEANTRNAEYRETVEEDTKETIRANFADLILILQTTNEADLHDEALKCLSTGMLGGLHKIDINTYDKYTLDNISSAHAFDKIYKDAIDTYKKLFTDFIISNPDKVLKIKIAKNAFEEYAKTTAKIIKSKNAEIESRKATFINAVEEEDLGYQLNEGKVSRQFQNGNPDNRLGISLFSRIENALAAIVGIPYNPNNELGLSPVTRIVNVVVAIVAVCTVMLLVWGVYVFIKVL